MEYRRRSKAELRTLLVRERLAGVAREPWQNWCLAGDPKRRPDCREEVVTPLGRTVFAYRGTMGQEYSFSIGTTEISFHYSVIGVSTGHPLPDDDSFATEIAPDGLAAFVDSFREASLEKLEALSPYE